jgi:O-antigen/teichoic acid export membrane protein
MTTTNETSAAGIAQPADLRRKRIVRTALSGVLTKAAAFLPTLGIAPLAISHLGTERFGVLMTVLSLLAFLSIADLGIGGSMVTGISRALGAGNQRRVRLLQANGLAAMAAIAGLVGLAAAGMAFGGVGDLIFPRSAAPVRDEATRALALFTFLFALGLPMTLVTKIQLGLQRGHVANNWQTLAGLLNFAGGALACLLDAGVPWIIAGLFSGTLLCGLANTLLQFNEASASRPALNDVRRLVLGHIVRESGFYLALQLIFVFTYAVDTLIVAHRLGAQEASSYALAERLFSVVAVAVSVVAGPLWAAYGEALGSGDHAWARRSLKLSLWRIAAVGSAIAGSLLLLFGPLVALFGSGALKVPLGIALSMAVWRVVEAVGGMVGLYLFATRAVRVVVFTGVVTAVVSLTLKTQLVEWLGPAVLPVTTTLCFLLFSMLPCALYIRRSNRTSIAKGAG